jgi:predicted dehydrogenase
METARRIAVWLSPEQAPLVRGVAAAAELEIVGAGSGAKGQSQGVASVLETKVIDDLRAMLTGVEAELVWIASPGGFGAGAGGADAEALQQARARGVKVATLEPIPGSALDLSAWGGGSERGPELARFVPLAPDSAPFRRAQEALQSFGHVRMVAVESWCRPPEGSLGARVFGTLALVNALLGEPEAIDAAYVAPSHGSGLHPLPGETLRDLSGDLCACMRFADGRIATMSVGDQGGRWNRTITLVGPSGRLRIFDDGFEWIGPGGEKVDEHRPKRARGSGLADHAAAAIADSLALMLDAGAPESPPLDRGAILAMAQATLLSARTGEPESPATIRHMVGGR